MNNLLRRIETGRLVVRPWHLVIGGIDLRFFEDGRIAELGYSVARSAWGGGVATEAGLAVVGAAFRDLPALTRVRAMADARNHASRRVLEKLGMRLEGTLRRNRFVRSSPVDEVWYGVLREEWQGQRDDVAGPDPR